MILFAIANGKNTRSQSMSGCFCYLLFWLIGHGLAFGELIRQMTISMSLYAAPLLISRFDEM